MSRAKPLNDAQKQIQSELFTLTYGVLVAQILEDVEDPKVVNAKLDKIGYNIGIRLIDDVFSRNITLERCQNLQETAQALITHGFKPYLNITPKIADWSEKQDAFTLILEQNPLTEFVELNEPEQFTKELESSVGAGDNIRTAIEQLELDDNQPSTKGLSYCQVLCGMIRGALEMVQIEVSCEILGDKLRKSTAATSAGVNSTSIRIKFIRRMSEAVPVGDS